MRIRSGAPNTVSEAVEPANMPTSKPRSSAMRAEIGSNTEPGWTHRSPDRTARKRLRRSVQCMDFAPSEIAISTGKPDALGVPVQKRSVQKKQHTRGNAMFE